MNRYLDIRVGRSSEYAGRGLDEASDGIKRMMHSNTHKTQVIQLLVSKYLQYVLNSGCIWREGTGFEMQFSETINKWLGWYRSASQNLA